MINAQGPGVIYVDKGELKNLYRFPYLPMLHTGLLLMKACEQYYRKGGDEVTG